MILIKELVLNHSRNLFMGEKAPLILIKGNEIVQDDWLLVSNDESLEININDKKQKIILPLLLWLKNKNLYFNRSNIGVWIDSDEDPREIGTDCNKLSLIAINFPIFNDGRGYSYAKILKENFNYIGELRAIGDVLCDQMYFYLKCGFTSFSIRRDEDPSQAIKSLNDFSMNYQAVSDHNQPIFHKRKL